MCNNRMVIPPPIGDGHRMPTDRDYILGTHQEEISRLGLQHNVWRPVVLDCWKRAGVTADNPQVTKAIAWLVSNQKEGTWPAHYPNRARNPQDNIGKFMRDAATAFAILALTEAN